MPRAPIRGRAGAAVRACKPERALHVRVAACRHDFASHEHPPGPGYVQPAPRRKIKESGIGEFGRIDVLVNNAVYQPAYGMKSFENTPIEEYDKSFDGNVLAGLYLIKLCLPEFKRRGSGVVINVTSGAGQNETSKQPGEGGWPFAYSITKAAHNRVAAGLAKELKAYNVAVVNLEPGFVATERMSITMRDQGIDPTNGLAVDVPGSVCAYVASSPNVMAFSGRTVDAPQFSVWADIVAASTLPHPYGPSNWGYPPFNSIGGTATGDFLPGKTIFGFRMMPSSRTRCS